MYKVIATLAAAFMAVCASVPSRASQLEPLQGKWAVTKTNQEGQVYSQFIEISKDQLTFGIAGADSQIRFIGKGTVSASNVPPFDILSITGIRAGRSEGDLQPVNDSRVFVYTLRDGNLFFASNFDKARENEQPVVDKYVRKAAGADDQEAKLVGKWKMEVVLAENTYDYELRIARANNRLEGVMVSPRSGEHRCKTVRFDKGEVIIEIDRDIQGTQATFVYRGKLTEGKLAGNFEVKEHEDQFSGPWKASKL